jgi:hypothetical protein
MAREGCWTAYATRAGFLLAFGAFGLRAMPIRAAAIATVDRVQLRAS